jgi:hypothetical protein
VANVHAVNYTYDVFKRVASVQVDSGTVMSYGYTEPKSSGGTADDGLLRTVGPLVITRDIANGLISGTTFSVTTGTVTHTVTEVYAYNPLGEVIHTTASVDGVVKFDEQLTRDYASNFAGSTNTGRVRIKNDTVQGTSTQWSFAYDASNRLSQAVVGATTRNYTYDANGNRQDGTTPVATYDSQDRLTSYAGVTYQYTPNGELARKGTRIGNPTFTYDLRGNLRASASVSGTSSYAIDPDGRRLGKLNQFGPVQQFVYGQGARPLAELAVDGTVKSIFVYGMRQYTPDFMVQGTTYYRIISDYLGSPRLIVNMADGTVAQQLDFDPSRRPWEVHAIAAVVFAQCGLLFRID